MERNYEKLERMREEIRKDKERIAAMQEQVRAKEARLRDAENTRILADVCAMKLSPEEIGSILDMIQAGKLSEVVSGNAKRAGRHGKQRSQDAISEETDPYENDFEETEEDKDDQN